MGYSLRLLISFFFIFSYCSIAQKKNFLPKAPVKFIEYVNNTSSDYNKSEPLLIGNYNIVDQIPNAFSGAYGSLNPMAFDPWSHTAAVVHRGALTYSTGTGQLWYNISTNYGLSWTRVSSPINTSPIQARFPSMAISNPTKGYIESTRGIFSWPELFNSTFGNIGYGKDEPLGSGNTFANIYNDTGNYSSINPCWVSDNSQWVFWTAENVLNLNLALFRTQDFINIEIINPPQWDDTIFNGGGNIILGGMSNNGIQYVGILGTLPDPDPVHPIASGWYPAYSKSTDNGVTWSSWNMIDFRIIPGLNEYDRLWDWIKNDNYVSYQGDMIVDNEGFVHIILGVTDTTTSTNTGNNAIVEIYETAAGWKGHVVAEMSPESDLTNWTYGTLNQNGYSAFLSKSPDGKMIAAQWAEGTNPAHNVDLFYSYRIINDTVWAVPQNLTNTPNISESISHMSPMMAGDNESIYTFFSMFEYDASSTVPPDENALTDIYLSAVHIFAGFSENGYVKVITPDGGENWQAGTSQTIQWVASSSDVDIFYSTNGGASWIPIIENFISNGSYDWVIPNTLSSNCKIKIHNNDIYGYVPDVSNGNFTITPAVSVKDEAPVISQYMLHQNYPNPFNPSTTISYDLPESKLVSIKIFDILGKEITTLVNKEQEAGRHNITFDASDLPGGVYFCQFRTGSFTHTNKLLLLK